MALQLLGFGLLIAIFCGSGVYWMETARLDTFVEHLSEEQARDLILSSNKGTGGPDMNASGEDFVFNEILAPDGRVIRSFQQRDLPNAVQERLRNLLRSKTDQHVNFIHDVRQYMFLSFKDARSGMRFSGLFRVGDELSKRLTDQIIGSVLAAVGIVLGTTFILIPVIGRLERQVIYHARDATDANIDALATLGGAIAKRDSDTDAHNYRVTMYVLRLAEALDLDRDAICHLIRGAFLHDVGKIAIPDAILRKPGRLTDDEFAVMKSHVQHGLDIVSHSRWLAPAAEVIAGHHEKYDGSGYPYGLAGEQIPLAARLFAVADVFDALTSARPYKPALPLAEAKQILSIERGHHFDPFILDRFLSLADELHATFNTGDEHLIRKDFLSELAHYFFIRQI
ncbi:cyclic di-GMP phosphodiesterase response regulator RpfG [mine drainage metagenome]|uniref:Cyclic di-GMP phosphodiesterase response regulator RpfG n=1 Tax=mine drainage metagenome TaxID=410659 RepID=A0A1J5RXI8_9ZZZZ